MNMTNLHYCLCQRRNIFTVFVYAFDEAGLVSMLILFRYLSPSGVLVSPVAYPTLIWFHCVLTMKICSAWLAFAIFALGNSSLQGFVSERSGSNPLNTRILTSENEVAMRK